MNSELLVRFEKIDAWEKFYKEIPAIQKNLKCPYFRGQGNKHSDNSSKKGWTLQPSLFRIPKNSHPRFINWLKATFITECREEIIAIFGKEFDIVTESDEKQKNRDLLIGLLQHLGFPTPLLDWTKDPFKAVYFAFESMQQDADVVTIYLLDQNSWRTNPNGSESLELRVTELKDIISIIPRQSAQDSVYIYCRAVNIYNEIEGDEFSDQIYDTRRADESKDQKLEDFFIAYCNLPVSEKHVIIKSLEDMGITHKSLYPDERDPKILALRKKIPSLLKSYIGSINQKSHYAH